MEQSPSWETDSRSVSEYIARFYDTRRFVTVSTSVSYWSLVLFTKYC